MVLVPVVFAVRRRRLCCRHRRGYFAPSGIALGVAVVLVPVVFAVVVVAVFVAVVVVGNSPPQDLNSHEQPRTATNSHEQPGGNSEDVGKSPPPELRED